MSGRAISGCTSGRESLGTTVPSGMPVTVALPETPAMAVPICAAVWAALGTPIAVQTWVR